MLTAPGDWQCSEPAEHFTNRHTGGLARGIIVLLNTPTLALLLMAKVLILGLRAANLTHSVPANVFQWELLRDGKGREKEVGGNEARGEEKKKKEKSHSLLGITSVFWRWKSARLPAAAQGTSCSRGCWVRRERWAQAGAAQAPRGSAQRARSAPLGSSREDSLAAKRSSSASSCRSP